MVFSSPFALTDFWSTISAVQAAPTTTAENQDPPGIYDIFASYVAGNEQAFDQFWAQVYPQIRRFVFARHGSQQGSGWCDDVAQETMWKIHQARERFVLRFTEGDASDRSLMSWALQICRNHALDQLRRAKTEQRAHQQIGEDGRNDWVNQQQDDVDAQRLDAVLEMVKALPPGQREIIELHTLRGLSMQEIAQQTQLKEGAVRTRASRAYAALRGMFGDEQP